MIEKIKAATSTANEKVNATEVASIEQLNIDGMEEQVISENGNAANAASVKLTNNGIMKERTTPENESVTYFTCDELGRLGKDLGIKPTAVKAHVDGEEVRIVVAHTEYGMRHDKKMDKTQKTANKEKLLTPRYHFCKPEIFWKEGYNLFDNNGVLIEQGTENILVICDTPETSERIYIDDFLEDVEIHDFESVADYAQHIGETVLISRMPSKVEEMGIAALATGDEAMRTVYEFAIDHHIPYTTALGFLDAEMKPIILKTMMRGIMPKSVFALGRSAEEAERIFKAASATFDTDYKKRYVPRALNCLLKKHNQPLDVVINALNTIPASEVTMAKLAECGEKESCIVGRMLMWILENNRKNENKQAA